MSKKIFSETVDGLLWLEGKIDKKGNPYGPGEGLRFEHRLVINASKEKIWAVLADVDNWCKWSPIYPKSQGELKLNSVMKLDIQVPGTRPLPSDCIIDKCVPGKSIHFKANPKATNNEKIMGGIRYIEIKEQDENHCIVTNGEVVVGIIGITLAKYIVRKGLFNGLRWMNEGLKKTVEERR